MDFYVDIAVAVIIRLLKDRRSVTKYYPALAKVAAALLDLTASDAEFNDLVVSKQRKGS